MSQIVNRRDTAFLLYEMFDLEALLQKPRYVAFDRDAVEGILDLAQAIAEQRYLPFAAELDANEPRFVDGQAEVLPKVGAALQAYADAGLFAASFDEDIGGMQLPWIVNQAVNGMFSAANAGVSSYSFLTIGAANLINAFGSDGQRATFLPPMLEGRWFGTMCLSEPQAGSSLSDILTKARPLGDGQLGNGRYSITGSKMWISGGDQNISANIVHMVLARIPGGASGVKGISLFIVPKFRVGDDGSIGASNNVALAGLNHKMGHRGTTNCLLNFGESGICEGWLVGQEHRGLSYMFHMMNEARVGVGHGAVMSGLAGYLYSLDYARTRLQGRHPQDKVPDSPPIPIIQHADVKRMLMAQKAAVEGALALVSYCALLIDRQRVGDDANEMTRIGLLLDILTPIAKSWPSEHCLEANKWAIQVLGGYGYTRDYPVERFYRDNRLNHIHEGTFAIHGLDLLGRKVSMQGGAALAALLTEIGKTIAAARPALPDATASLETALAALNETIRIVAAHPDGMVAMANATLFLDAMGHIVIAWMWLWQGHVAAGALEDCRASDKQFYHGKIAACRYFYRYELPKAMTQLALVQTLDDSCVALEAEQFIGW